MKDTRIGLLCIVNSLCFGGAEKHIVTLANALDLQHYRLSFAFLKDDTTLLPQLALERLEGRLLACQAKGKLDLRVMRQLARHIDDADIDVIVSVNPYSMLYARVAAWLARKSPQVVQIVHSIGVQSFKDRMQMLFYRPFFLSSDMLVYVCNKQRDHWRARLLRGQDDCVIHNGIDIDHFTDRYTSTQKVQLRQTYGFTADDYVVGICATMRPEKNHHHLLLAIATLGCRHPELKCLLIGDGMQRSRLESDIVRLGLQDRVRITGFLSDIRPAVSICDAMALTSTLETFSISALESMALGKVMIMTDVGGAREQIDDGESGFLYPIGSIAALSELLSRLSDKSVCRTMGARARSMMETRYSVQAMVAEYHQLFSVRLSRNTSSADHVRPA